MLVDFVVAARMRIAKRTVHIPVATKIRVKSAFVWSDIDTGMRDEKRAHDAAFIEQ